VTGKTQNPRQIVLRSAREADDPSETDTLRKTADALGNAVTRFPQCEDLKTLRGIEGESDRAYFSTFDHMIREDRETFKLNGPTGARRQSSSV
jgi:CRISPR-associated protein Cas1